MAAKAKLWVYGDSLSWESGRYIKKGLHGFKAKLHAFGGAAVCDMIQFLDADLSAAKKAKNYPTFIMLETAGNSESDCMRDPATGSYYVSGSDAYYAKYTHDIGVIADIATTIHSRLAFITAPPTARSGSDTRLESIETATGWPVTDVPQQAVAPNGVFAWTLPCLATESKRKGCVNGQITVRAPDGRHFCPTGLTADGCAVYSSGEKRWGDAIGQAANELF